MRPMILAAALLSVCAPATPDDWTRHEMAFGAFTMAVPPDMAPEEVEGTDSFAAAFVNRDLRIDVDYGLYGGLPLVKTDAPRRERISGQAVDVIERFDRGVGDLYALFESPPRRGSGGVLEPTDALSLHVACATPEACEVGRVVLHSVRF